MSRPAINFLLDFILLILVLVLMWTTAILQFIFPVATQSAGWQLWGLGFDAWHRIHTASLAVLMLGILIHLILHWTWVCGFIATKIAKWTGRKISTNESTRTLYGVATLAIALTLVGGAVLAAELMIHGGAK